MGTSAASEPLNPFIQPNELSSPIEANFCSAIFWLRFSFLCYFFLLIGIFQLDNDVLKVLVQKFQFIQPHKERPLI